MTDDDFDKIDEDFANEFDFVDPKKAKASAAPSGGSTSTKTTATAPGPAPKGSPVKAILILLSAVGLGFFVYTHFIAAKKPESPPSAAQAHAANASGPQAEHTPNAAPLPHPEAPHPAGTPNANAQPNSGLAPDHLAAALPNSADSKSFEEVQKELQASRSTSAQANSAQHTVNMEVKSTLQHMSEEMTVNVNNIKQLEVTIAQLAATIDQLHKSITAMDNRVLGLTETVDSLSQDVSNVKKVIADDDLDLTNPGTVKLSPGSQVAPLSSTAPNYSVHAIIPGRAWLKNANGQIITVTDGDKVGDYGTIAVIDAANGIVRTSSGIIFR